MYFGFFLISEWYVVYWFFKCVFVLSILEERDLFEEVGENISIDWRKDDLLWEGWEWINKCD